MFKLFLIISFITFIYFYTTRNATIISKNTENEKKDGTENINFESENFNDLFDDGFLNRLYLG